MFPQPRDNFSVGAEQSLSTVVGVAWSPPGLAKYRRSVLAVLTSNMVLSLYALSGTSERWLRIAIVNQALEIFFRESIENNTLTTRFQSFFRRDAEDKSPRTRKTNIRAFSWTPPLKVPAKNQLYSGPESRWGVPLVTVANDDNDLVFLQVQQPESQQGSSGSLDVEAVSSIHLPASPSYGQVLQPGSILSSALQTQVRMSSLTSGPWIYEPGGSGQDAISATVNVAALQGMKLRVAKFTVGVELRAHDSDGGLRYSLTFDVVENNAMPLARLEEFQCTGPMHWAHKVGHFIQVPTTLCPSFLTYIIDGLRKYYHDSWRQDWRSVARPTGGCIQRAKIRDQRFSCSLLPIARRFYYRYHASAPGENKR